MTRVKYGFIVGGICAVFVAPACTDDKMPPDYPGTSMIEPPPPDPTGSARPARPREKQPDDATKAALGDDPDDACTSDVKFNPARTGCDDNGVLDGAAKSVADGCASLVVPDTDACGPRGNIANLCTSKTAALKPALARAAFACMMQHASGSGAALCEPCTMDRCEWEALMSACPDPAAAADCDDIAGTCGGVDKAKCSSYLSGLTSAARKNAVGCVKEDCSRGLYACAMEAAAAP
jgi:hypothetical protein